MNMKLDKKAIDLVKLSYRKLNPYRSSFGTFRKGQMKRFIVILALTTFSVIYLTYLYQNIKEHNRDADLRAFVSNTGWVITNDK